MASGRFPHAFLLVGPEGVGKGLFATTLAQAILCEAHPAEALDPCGKCPSCAQIIEGTHPDVLRASKPEDRQELPIKAIRDLCIDLGLKPMHGTRRVAIVEDADDLSEEAANAFLKTLEEPPPGSVLMLVGMAAESQIATIVSRCRVLRFEPLNPDDLAAILLDRGLAPDRDSAEALARRSDGSLARARGLSDPDFATVRREMVSAIASAPNFDAMALARRLDSYSKDAGKEAGPQRERAVVLLGELARLFRSVLWQTAGVEPESSDESDRNAIATIAEKLEPEDAFILAERCLDASSQVGRNASRTLIFEAALRDVARILNRG